MRSVALASMLALLVVSSVASAQAKPLITPKDYGKWENIGAVRLSPRGDWAAVNITRVSEEHELRLRGGPRDTTIAIAFGATPAFSADNAWVAYAIGVSPKERERLTRERKPVRNAFMARHLASGRTIALSDINTFSFSPDARYLAVTRYPAEGKRTSELLTIDLARDSRLVLANVSEVAWASQGALLALTVDTDGGAGNAVQLFDLGTGVLRVLESNTGSQYRGIAWRPKSSDLAVLRTVVDKAFKDTAHVLVAWTGLGTPKEAVRRLDPSAPNAAQNGLPARMRIADGRRPAWSRDGRIITLGLRTREPVADAIKRSEEKVSDVEVWHTNDVRMFPLQKSQEAQDLRASYLTVWRLADDKVVQVSTDLDEPSTVLEGARYATEIDRKPYAWGWKFGRNDQDVWTTDLATGERRKSLEKVRHYYGANPQGTRLAWSDGKDIWTTDIASGARTNLTAALTTAGKADFVDRDDDHPNNVAPTVGIAGWTRKGDALLANDNHDVWRLPLDGSGGTRLTNGASEGVVHRLVSFAPFNASADERAFDLSQPLYVTLYGKRTKQSGFARLHPGGRMERLVLADASIRGLTRADSAPVFSFTRQRYDEAPTLLIGTDVAAPRTLVTTNAHAKDFAWGKVEQFDFRSTIDVPLQALLYYPANYDASKKYPLIVYTYERLTQGLHGYIAPNEQDYYNATVFTQQGYFVLMPDIVFRPREPGIGTVQSVEAAVKRVIGRGLVDPARVGHVGHSQGGYEAAYLATHSDMFQTTIMGSGISDMISFAGQLHWTPGTAEFDHWETGQFRMEVAPWEDFPAMLANSPLAKAHEMKAKAILIEAGADDGTVDPRQASLFYNYLRRAGKDAVLLMYPGEGHGLAKKENRIDYERRILQWFAHYLKGEPAAAWMTNGMRAVDRRALLDANKDAPVVTPPVNR